MLTILLLQAAWASEPERSSEPSPQDVPPIALARLFPEVGDGPQLGLSDEQALSVLTRHLKERGYTVAGASDALFQAGPQPQETRWQLGGSAEAIDCLNRGQRVVCEIAFTWELYDAQARQVVYTTTTRSLSQEKGKTRLTQEMAQEGLRQNLDSLLGRDGFQQSLRMEASQATAAPRSDPPDESRMNGQFVYEKEERTPMRPGTRRAIAASGLLAGGLGASLGTWAWHQQDPEVGRLGWTGMKVGNAAGWAMVGTGAGLFTYSIIRGKDGADTQPRTVEASLSPTHVQVGLRF